MNTPQSIKTQLAQLAVNCDKYTPQELADLLIRLAADVTMLIPGDENVTVGKP